MWLIQPQAGARHLEIYAVTTLPLLIETEMPN